MKICIDIPDYVLLQFAHRASASGIGIEEEIVNFLTGQSSPAHKRYLGMSRKDRLDEAIIALVKKEVGSTFTLRSLILDEGWETLSDGDRRQLGKEMKVAALKSNMVVLMDHTFPEIYKKIDPAIHSLEHGSAVK